MPQKVIIDTDPGIDDMAAILFALGSPELEVVAITTCFGNVEVAQCTRNALLILEAAGRADIPVYPGAARPLLRQPHYAKYVHGDNGLGGIELPAVHSQPQSRRAVDAIIERAMAEPGAITLLALAPPTNVALALAVEPRLATAMKQLVIMGGVVYSGGNVTPVASANFVNDPEAAAIVFRSGVRPVQIGLDVCRPAFFSDADLAQLFALNTPQTRLLQAATPFLRTRYHASGQLTDGVQYNDVPAVAYAVAPELFAGQAGYVVVETTSPLAMGQTIVNFGGLNTYAEHSLVNYPPNAVVMLTIDAAGMKERVLQAYRRLGEISQGSGEQR